jgi:hypothetical protein
MKSNVLPKDKKPKETDLGSKVSVKRMRGKMHESINIFDITIKSKIENIDSFLKKMEVVI